MGNSFKNPRGKVVFVIFMIIFLKITNAKGEAYNINNNQIIFVENNMEKL